LLFGISTSRRWWVLPKHLHHFVQIFLI